MELEKLVLHADGCPIHYWIAPRTSGPWLIFLHGAGADHRMFEEQLKALDHTFNILLWDARGHGRSRPIGAHFSVKQMVDDLLRIMDKEQIEKATVIGQSMGGNTAQELAFSYPEKVEHLVLIDCTWNMLKLTAVEKLAIWMTPFLLGLYPWKQLVQQSVQASSIRPHVRSYLSECFFSVGRNDFKKILSETTACLHTEEHYRIGKPFLLVCGEFDRTGNIKRAVSEWQRLDPDCEFHWIENASHCSNQDNPDKFNELLNRFLDRHYGTSIEINGEG